MARKNLPRRVNSKSPAHRRTIARQNAGRSRGVRAGKLRTGKVHYRKKDGKRVYVSYAPLMRKDKKTGKISYTSANTVPVVLLDGTTVLMDARTAARKQGKGELVLQELRR